MLRIRLLVGGRPQPITSAIPKIRLCPIKSPIKGPDSECEDFDLEAQGHSSDDERSDDGKFWAQEQEENEDDRINEDFSGYDSDASDSGNDHEDARRRLVKMVNEVDDENDSGSEADSDDNAETGLKTKDKDYVFCLLPHRVTILRLFAKHASQHSLLPERHGEHRTAEHIRRDAVTEMYHHCERNHLCEVWAYLWNNWYAPNRWPLWARSSHEMSVPRHRTTMMVEALWRNLKRLVLHMYNRPPLDLAVYALITKAIPPYRKTLSTLTQVRAGGRPEHLTHMQEALKKAWRFLEKVPIKGNYNTNVAQWTCDCGAQKYHACLLCKHLVQAVGPIPAAWWTSVTRYRQPPFYTAPIDGVVQERSDSDRASVVAVHQPIDSDSEEVEELPNTGSDDSVSLPTLLMLAVPMSQ